jgi:gas vesicle protein
MKGLNEASALMLGIGTGVAVGILFAPKSGLQIRTDLNNQLLSAKTKVQDQVNAAIQSASDVIEHRKQDLLKTKIALKRAVDAGAKAYHEPVQACRQSS